MKAQYGCASCAHRLCKHIQLTVYLLHVTYLYHSRKNSILWRHPGSDQRINKVYHNIRALFCTISNAFVDDMSPSYFKVTTAHIARAQRSLDAECPKAPTCPEVPVSLQHNCQSSVNAQHSIDLRIRNSTRGMLTTRQAGAHRHASMYWFPTACNLTQG